MHPQDMHAHEQQQPLLRESAPSESAHAVNEIGELRRFIVDMMHSEVELMERIKQSEETVDAVNARVERFKTSIRKEQARNSELKRTLAHDLRGLQQLEERRTLVEAKQKQIQDAITKRSTQVTQLHRAYQTLRAGMIATRAQTKRASEYSKELAQLESSTDAKIAQARAQLDEPMCLNEISAERQKLRAKKRFIEQHSAQMEAEANSFAEQNLQLAAALQQTQVEIQAVRLAVKSEEKEAERNRQQLQHSIAELKSDNTRTRTKLKAKRKKLRTQMKNEMASLRRRITFVSSELERAQMANEDMCSVIGALKAEQDTLDSKLQSLCDDIRCKEASIAELEAKVSDFDRGSSRFSTADMQRDLDAKRAQLQKLNTVLREKETAASVQETEISQLKSRLSKVTNTPASAATSSGTDSHADRAKEEIRELEARTEDLRAATSKLAKQSRDLEDQVSAARATNRELNKELASLYDSLSEVNKESEQLAAKLADQRVLDGELDKALRYTQVVHVDADQPNKLSSKEQRAVDRSVREHEQQWKRKCTNEEAKLEAELQEWDDKIRQAQSQLAETRVH